MANESLLEPPPLVEKPKSVRYADWLTANKNLSGTPEFKDIAKAYEVARRDEESLTLPVALQEAAAEFVPSTIKLGKEVVTGAADALSYPFREPVEFAKTVYGFSNRSFPSIGGSKDETPLTRIAPTIGGHYAGYLDPDVLKRRLADNPASTLSDLSLVGYGLGRALKAVPTAPTEYVGGKLAAASEAVDPLTIATKAAAYPFRQMGDITLPGIPSVDQLKTQSRDAYKRAAESGVFYNANQFDDFIDNLNTNLRDQEGKRVTVLPELHPKSNAVLQAFSRYKGSNKTLEDMDDLRRIARDAASAPDPADRRVGMIIRNKIDDFILNESPVGGEAGVEALKEARGYWSRARKGDVIEDLMFDARLDSKGTFTGAGVENAMRREFKRLAKSNDFRLFNKDEQRAILSVVEGGPFSNATRLIGKFAPTGVVSGTLGPTLGSAVGFGAAGPWGLTGAAVVPAVGAAGRLAATRATETAAARASAKIRAGNAPANVREKLALLLSQYGDQLSTVPGMAFAVDMAKRAKGNVNPYLTRQLISQLENIQRISEQRQALERAAEQE
jgi:hypothetical protein